MKKKDIIKMREKSIAELEKELLKIQKEVSLLKLENKANPPKDTNTVAKQKKQRAVINTIINEMKLAKNVPTQ